MQSFPLSNKIINSKQLQAQPLNTHKHAHTQLPVSDKFNSEMLIHYAAVLILRDRKQVVTILKLCIQCIHIIYITNISIK